MTEGLRDACSFYRLKEKRTQIFLKPRTRPRRDDLDRVCAVLPRNESAIDARAIDTLTRVPEQVVRAIVAHVERRPGVGALRGELELLAKHEGARGPR